MMAIEKLPSGAYRITKMKNGVRYRVTVTHKPTKKEAEILIQEKMFEDGVVSVENGSVLKYAERYLNQCEKNGLSPSTIYAYKSIIKNTPAWFLVKDINKVTILNIQKCIDEYSESHSPKSVRNFNGFYKRVFADLRNISFDSIKLPSKAKKAEYEPTTKDIQRILEHEAGSKYELIISLLCLGLRRGEALAITSDDLSGDNVLTINKDMVYKGSEYVIKPHPKTEASFRRILIPDTIADMLRDKGKSFDGNPHMVGKHLTSVQEKLGIPHFRLHILRHYASALLHKNGFTDRQIMAYMGWSSIQSLHATYNYNLDPEETQKPIASTFDFLLRG